MEIALYTSFNEEKNQRARTDLRRVEGVVIIEVPITKTLEKKVPTPFIETPDGAQRFGLQSINKYVERERVRLNGNNGQK